MSDQAFTVDAVLFDLDGTLVDSLPDIAESANRMLAELGRPLRDVSQIRCFVGKGIPNLVQRCLAEGSDATAEEVAAAIEVFHRHYARVNGQCSSLYPDVVDALLALRGKGLKLACATNKAEAFTRPLLERMGIAPYFDAVVSGDTLAVKKPDPAMFVHACALLGVTRALVVGDSANDAIAARAAGLPVLLVTYGYSEGVPVDTLECDGLLSTTRDVLDRIVRPEA